MYSAAVECIYPDTIKIRLLNIDNQFSNTSTGNDFEFHSKITHDDDRVFDWTHEQFALGLEPTAISIIYGNSDLYNFHYVGQKP